MTVPILPDVALGWFPDLPVTTRAPQVALLADGNPLRPPYSLFPAGRIETPELGIALLARANATRQTLALRDGAGAEHHAVASADVAALLPRLTPAARLALLQQLLDVVPRFLRGNGPALAGAVRRVLDAISAPECTVAAAYDLGEGETLLRCRSPTPPAVTAHYRVAADGVRPAQGPIDPTDELRVVQAAGAEPAGPDLLVGVAGASAWRIRLDELRPRPAGSLIRHVAALDAGAGAALVQALRRWQAGRPERPAALAAVVDDCAAFVGAGRTGGDRRPGGAFECGIDALVPVPGGGVLVQGWLFDPRGRAQRLDATDCRGTRIALPELWPVQNAKASELWRGAGLPVPERAGFVGFADGGADGPWTVEAVLRSGARIEVAAPPPEPDPRRARDLLLTGLAASAEIDGAITAAIAPAVERLHAAHMARHPEVARVRSRVEIGRRPERPRASIVIPLYRNLNFLGFQLAAFAADPALAEVELVYVLDSPEQAEYLEGRLRGEHLIYRLPVTIAVHAENLGFASAANTGARVAAGADLVFLNSDVVPERPGWLQPLLAALDRPGVGAAGPQLLYLDDSLQFAGLYFERDADGVWFNRHVAKGFPRSHPAAGVAREVPALTGACLAVRRSLFERVGGFDDGFVIGDFEDSDLCLRLRAAGLGCWYEPAAVLYHVERQSIDRHEAHGKSVATMVNRWRQQQRWGREIEALMADREARWGLPPSLMPEIVRIP